MKGPFESVYPDFLRSGLDKLKQHESQRELVALFAALEHFRRDLHSQDTVSGILSVSRRYIAELNLFRTFGFWTVNPMDYGFEFSLAAPETETTRLKQMVAAQIKAGRFAFALRQDTPVFFHFGEGPSPERGLLHSLALSSQVIGMFCGLLETEVTAAQEVALSVLSILLGASADALATLRKTRQLTSQIETLQTLLPLCAWCKKVRNDSGYWDQIEKYITKNSGAKITHGICPECQDKMLRAGTD
jgi:hypothetical protein